MGKKQADTLKPRRTNISSYVFLLNVFTYGKNTYAKKETSYYTDNNQLQMKSKFLLFVAPNRGNLEHHFVSF